MAKEFIENVEAYLRLNTIGDMSDKLTINYIQMSLNRYRKQAEKSTQEKIAARNAVTTYYGGINPLD